MSQSRVFVFGLLGIWLAVFSLQAQPERREFGVGFVSHVNFLVSDAAEAVPGFGGGLAFAYPLNDRLNLTATTGYGVFAMKLANSLKKSVSPFVFGNVALEYELKTEKVRPFIYTGLGVLNFKPVNGTARYFDGEIMAGLGLRIFLARTLAVNVTAGGSYTSGDSFDGILAGGREFYAKTTVGLTFYRHRPAPRRYDDDDPYFTDRGMVDYPSILPEETKDEQEIAASESTQSEEEASVDELALELLSAEAADSGEESTPVTAEQGETQPAADSLASSYNAKKFSGVNSPDGGNFKQGGAEDVETSERPEPALPATRRPAPFDFMTAYRNALSEFNNKHYLDAIETLQTLLQQFPGHELASNCMYWMGESYFGLKNYEAAAAHFERVINNYVVSPKSDDALLMLALTYMKLGDLDKAILSLSRLLMLYPDSEYASKAQRYLARLRS